MALWAVSILISNSPFHVAVGIMTTRMLINLRKFTAVTKNAKSIVAA